MKSKSWLAKIHQEKKNKKEYLIAIIPDKKDGNKNLSLFRYLISMDGKEKQRDLSLVT